jgi:tetratricopeptide (TPR) repeat protein
VYCRLCRGDEAQAAYSRLPEPRTELELFLRGTLDRDLNKDASARSLEYFERAALAAGAPHLWVHINWATFAESEGDEASCRRCAANLLLNWPDDPIAIYFAALALHRTQPERAAQLVQQALQQHPEIGLLHCAEGMLLRARGEPKAAIAAVERAVARSPRLATLHYSLGAARYDTGDTAGAIAAFTAARDLTPRFAEAWIGLGMALRRAGRLEESRAALQEAAQLNGSSADARFQYGQTLVLMDRIREGAVALKAAVELRAKDPNQWHHLANALFRIGDDEGGFQALRGAVTVAPTNERAHHLLVLGLRQTGQATAARAAVKAWVEALPQSLDGWLQFGLDCIDPALADDQRDAPGGIWAARRALSISAEQSALAWYVLGAAEALLGHTDPARDALQRSLDAKETPLSEPERSRCAERLRELGGPRAASLGK